MMEIGGAGERNMGKMDLAAVSEKPHGGSACPACSVGGVTVFGENFF